MDKLAELIGSLKDYFNDFVGAVVPGTALAAGVLWLCADYLPMNALYVGWGEWNWLPGLALIFLLGHALLALNELLTRELMRMRKRPAPSVSERARDNGGYRVFLEVIRPRMKELRVDTELDFNTARNIAMSLSANGADLGRRFMFISLFCYGTSTAAWVVAALDVVLIPFGSPKDPVLKGIFAILLACTALLLRRRGNSFELRALTVPFSVATAEFLAPKFKVAAAANGVGL